MLYKPRFATTHMQEAHYKKHDALPRGFIEDILDLARAYNNDKQGTKEEFIKCKATLTRKHGLDHVPSDIEILTYLNQEELAIARNTLLTKPVRTGSGVTVVAVMTKPLPCTH